MEFRSSTVVDPMTYETDGLCESIPLRWHNTPEIEEIWTLRCQEDWRKYVGPLGFYKGGLGPRWSFIATTIPECIPERLGIVSYANELGFLHDGRHDNKTSRVNFHVTDIASLNGSHNDDWTAAFEQGAEKGRIENSASGKRALLSKIALEMLALNKEQAVTTLKAWAEFAELGSGRQHQRRFKTEDEYIAYRLVDVGKMFWYGLMTFAMGISIPKDDLDLCHRLASIAYIHLSLTNDLYSWQRECETAKAMGQDHVFNAISVLMEEHSVSEEEAKVLCKEKIKMATIDFRKIVRNTNERTDVSVESKRYLEALLYSMSGNVVWSLECPRYQTWASYNKRQLSMMRNGVPEADKTSTSGVVTHENSSPRRMRTENATMVASYPTPEFGNVFSEKQTFKGDEPSIGGNDSLVNVFVIQNFNGLNGAEIEDKNVIPTSESIRLET